MVSALEDRILEERAKLRGSEEAHIYSVEYLSGRLMLTTLYSTETRPRYS